MLSSYYQHGLVTIYHGDCRKILPELPMVDLILTDIPFNVDLKYESYDDKLSRGKYSALCKEWFRAMQNCARCYIVKVPTKALPTVLPLFDEAFNYVWTFIQYSPNATTHGAFNLSLFTQYLIGGSVYKRPDTDIIVNTSNRLVTTHPAEMPAAPIRRLISLFSNAGDTILDPFMGSGTFIVASKDLNRKCIGIEIEEKYCKMAISRCNQLSMELDT